MVGAPWRIRGGDDGGGAAALVLVLLAQAEGGFFGGGSEAYWVSLSCALRFCCSPCLSRPDWGPCYTPGIPSPMASSCPGLLRTLWPRAPASAP